MWRGHWPGPISRNTIRRWQSWPRSAATPPDLARHDCINLPLMSHGEIYGWELRHGAQQVNLRVDGTLVIEALRCQG